MKLANIHTALLIVSLFATLLTGCNSESSVPAAGEADVVSSSDASGPEIVAVANRQEVQIAGTEDFVPPPISIPEGFELEIVAAPPLVKHPMLAAFDDRGRLFVAETDGQNLRKDELLAQKPRFIRMLEDTNDDGKFDKSTIFADNMVMPEGALWHDNALYVISAPYLWRLEDTDDDGVADKREKLVGKFDFNGNPNLTGPYLGPCGRIYFTGGAFGYDLVDAGGVARGAGGAASVFSVKPDGTDLQIMSQGPINPVEVMWTPEGELFTTNAIFDSFGGRHDALVHWIEGSLSTKVYGKPLLPETGFRIPAVCRWGTVAPAGLMRVRNNTLTEDFHQNIFACQFDTHRVVRVELERHGASFLPKRDETFLSSTSIDFHPTDIFEDADGSLLMIDTGGWLYFGCPTSKIAKPNVYGAIYRLRQKGAPKVEDGRGLKLNWEGTSHEEMVTWLDDSRPYVRDRAIDRLAVRGEAAVSALKEARASSDSVQRRRNAVWTLSRIDTPAAVAAIRSALDDESESVRHSAVRSLGVLKDTESVTKLVELYKTEAPQVRLAVASALSKIRDSQAVPAILEGLARDDNDDYLMHAQIHTLIRLNDFEATKAGLTADNPRVRRSALIALDQMEDNRLTHDLVLPLLSTNDQLLRTSAIDVIGKHEDWADQIQSVVSGWVDGPELAADDAVLAEAISKTFARDQGIQPILAAALARDTTPLSTRRLILRALASSDLKAMPERFSAALLGLLKSGNVELVEQVVTAMTAKDTEKLDDALIAISRDSDREDPLRLASLAIPARHGYALEDQDFEFLHSQFDDEVLAVDRSRAAEALAAATLNHEQTIAVAKLMQSVGPLEFPALLKRFERDTAPIVVNVDVQPEKKKTHRGVAAYLDEPQEHRAIWNTWNPISGQGFELLVTSDGSFSGVSVSKVEGAKLLPYTHTKYDDLLNDFVYSGLPAGGGEHQAFQNEFTISGLKKDTTYDLYFFGTAYPKPAAYRGSKSTVTDASGPTSISIRGLMRSDEPYQEGVTHALFKGLVPRADGTLHVHWTAGDHDQEGNFGMFNGLTLVAPAAPEGRDPRVGKALVAALSDAEAVSSVPPERLQKLFARYPTEVVNASEPIIANLYKQQEKQAETLAELMPKIANGNPQKGRDVFYNDKAACYACHRIGGRGAEVGPDLSLIGRIRRDRDLLESIIFPSSTIANGYDRFIVLDVDGRTYDGVIGGETVDAIYLRNQGKEDVRIPRDSIDAMDPHALSIMPQGLEKQITIEQLRNLIAYLRSLK